MEGGREGWREGGREGGGERGRGEREGMFIIERFYCTLYTALALTIDEKDSH